MLVVARTLFLALDVCVFIMSTTPKQILEICQSFYLSLLIMSLLGEKGCNSGSKTKEKHLSKDEPQIVIRGQSLWEN